MQAHRHTVSYIIFHRLLRGVEQLMVGPPTGRVNETVGVGQRVGQRTFYVQFCAWVFSLHVLNLINTDQQDKTMMSYL